MSPGKFLGHIVAHFCEMAALSASFIQINDNVLRTDVEVHLIFPNNSKRYEHCNNFQYFAAWYPFVNSAALRQL